MPNPRVTFRLEPEYYDQLPSDDRERSLLLKQLVVRYLAPESPEDKLSVLERRVSELERRLNLNG
jgi:hypothetical protein